MVTKKYKVLFLIILCIWFLMNLLQAVLTEILSDEAYYSLFAKYLAWGYFDHPPMVALFVKISSSLFSGNAGIRLMTVLVQPFTLLIIWMIIDERQPSPNKVLSFYIIAASICIFSVFGFISTPDAPLLFFTALFLLSYKNYLHDQSWKNVLFLSLSMAGLVYSKYHALIVIGLVVLSNIKLLKAYKFWVAGLFALLLLSPHIWWQVSNGYPSIKFNLVARSEGFSFSNILEYLPGQMLIFNPLIFGAVYYIMFKSRPKDIFNRALYYLVIGFTLFFGLAAFHDHVEPHWTVASSVAMIIILYNNSIENPKIHQLVYKALLPSFMIILAIRILLVSNLSVIRSLGFSGKKEKFEYIGSVAKDLPVLFLGSFPYPSLYTCFTGKEGIAVNSLYSRKTQFDLWQPEKKYNNKPAFICGFGEGNSQLYEKNGYRFYGYATDSLQTVNRIEVMIAPVLKILTVGDSLYFSISLKNPYDFDINFNHKYFPVDISMAFIRGNELNIFPVVLQKPVDIIHSGDTLTRTVKTIVPDLRAGKYNFGITLNTLFGPAINDSFSAIKLVKK
jgi:hypothetical protein